MSKNSKIKVAVFGSYYRGYHILNSLLNFQKLSSTNIKIVGVASDDPISLFISPHKRVWQYPHEEYEKTMVLELARKHNIDTYHGKVKSDEFYKIFLKKWKPDICYMGIFGQLIDPKLFNFPKFGFYNLHAAYDDKWPSYPGCNPFYEMLRDGKKYAIIALHEINKKFDEGKLIDRSPKIMFPKSCSVIDMQKKSAPYAGQLVIKHLKDQLTIV